jgi:ComF family protein
MRKDVIHNIIYTTLMLIEQLLSIIAPHLCVGCNSEGHVLCTDCASMSVNLPSRCYRCLQLTDQYRTCRSCSSSTVLRHVWTPVAYQDRIIDMLHSLKYGHAQAAARDAARVIYDCLPYLKHEEFCIVPIPTSPQRVRQRGYDQAVLIAKEVAHLTNCPYRSLLIRTNNHQQVGASRPERLRYKKDPPFRIKRSHTPRDKKILLIDDVLTTGSTMESAAICLKRAGFTWVAGAVVARA